MTGHDPERIGWVYYAFAVSPETMEVKIGFTANLKARMSSLRSNTVNPAGQWPIVLAVELGTLVDEANRHAQFADLSLGREWFRYESPLREHIAAVAGEHPGLVDKVLRGFVVDDEVGDVVSKRELLRRGLDLSVPIPGF